MDRNTILFTNPEKRKEQTIEETLRTVYEALNEKGYNAIDQMVGYLLSGDPTYITSYKDARNKLRQYERYELVEALLESYLAAIKK